MQKPIGNCCLCVPMGVGMYCFCIYNILYSFVCMVALTTRDPRILNGGYNLDSCYTSASFGVFGLIFGVIGYVGVMDNRVPWVKWYNYFQYTKLVVAIFVFAMDIYMLETKCSSWYYKLESQVNFNPALENVAMKGLCHWTRDAYITGFIVDFAVHSYFAFIGYVYCERLSQLPPHIIWFPGKGHGGHVEGYNPAIGEPGAHLRRDVTAIDASNPLVRASTLQKSMYGAL